jgi:hypothetical protein
MSYAILEVLSSRDQSLLIFPMTITTEGMLPSLVALGPELLVWAMQLLEIVTRLLQEVALCLKRRVHTALISSTLGYSATRASLRSNDMILRQRLITLPTTHHKLRLL